MGDLRERIAQAIMAEDLLRDDRAKNEPDYCSVDARVDAVMSVLASWQSLMAILDEHYPPEVFDGSSGDEGPRIVALTREIDHLRREVEFEAKGDGWTDLEYAIFAQPTCACITDEQAAALGPGFSRPVCAVHPEEPISPSITVSPVAERYHYQDVDQTVLDVGGDPLSATPWADPEYKGGGVE